MVSAPAPKSKILLSLSKQKQNRARPQISSRKFHFLNFLVSFALGAWMGFFGEQHYRALPCHKVLLQYYCTTKCHSSTTLRYKVTTIQVLLCPTKYCSSTTKCYSSTTQSTTEYCSSTALYYRVLLQYYCVLQSATPVA